MSDDYDLIQGIESGEVGYEEVGSRGGRRVIRRIAPPAISSAPAGAHRIARKRVPVGLGTHTFTNAAADTKKVFEVEPQRDIQPERLVVDVTKAGGATEAVSVTSIKCADIEQLPTSNGVPSSMFAKDAVGASMDLSPVKGGTKFVVTVELDSALEAGETITVEVGCYAEVLGQ